jgi:hypothetical protein
MDTKKVWLWLLLIVVAGAVSGVTKIPSGRAAEPSSDPVYIFKELEGNTYRQENLRVQIKSQYAFIISLRVGTTSGNSQWIDFSTAAGSSSYQPDLIEIPLNKSYTDGKWHGVETFDLDDILTQVGDTYDHLEKIGIRGTNFQLGDIEFFSGDASDPVDLQVMSFDDPTASNMNQYEWYSNDASTQGTLYYQPDGNYLQVNGQTSTSSAQTTSSASTASSAYSANFYPFLNYSSPWTSSPVYPPYVPPPPSLPPLFGLGYPPGSPPYGFGPQPVLSLLTLAGLPAYSNDLNPGYPYSVGGYNFSTLFATGSSPYPYASPFADQTYNYLASALAPANPTYNIFNSSVTSTLAPPATISGLLSTGGFGGGGGGGIGGGGGFAGGALI